jgi:hypothetical protein
VVLKWIGVGAIGGAVALSAGAAGLRAYSRLGAPAPARAVPTAAATGVGHAPAPALGGRALDVTEEEPVFDAPVRGSVDAPAKGPVAVVKRDPPATAGAKGDAPRPPREVPLLEGRPANDPLVVEVSMLEAARAELVAGSSGGAIAMLDRYVERYPKGQLGLEAKVLRIEAVYRSGRHGEASTLADSFLREHPNSPLAPRVRAVVTNAIESGRP